MEEKIKVYVVVALLAVIGIGYLGFYSPIIFISNKNQVPANDLN